MTEVSNSFFYFSNGKTYNTSPHTSECSFDCSAQTSIKYSLIHVVMRDHCCNWMPDLIKMPLSNMLNTDLTKKGTNPFIFSFYSKLDWWYIFFLFFVIISRLHNGCVIILLNLLQGLKVIFKLKGLHNMIGEFPRNYMYNACISVKNRCYMLENFYIVLALLLISRLHLYTFYSSDYM